MAFQPESLLVHIPGQGQRYFVAFSGGLDSHVLIHAMVALRDSGFIAGEVRAIHVNHGLNTQSDAWATHCQAICKLLDVPLDMVSIKINAGKMGLENAAREARYRVFAAHVKSGDCLLTAHHLDDQVETQLFRLMRGTGIRGMGGIPRQRIVGGGILLRPMLDFSRDQIHAYAYEQKLSWVEDDSNADSGFDRNYLRHDVIPVIMQRWPGFRKNMQRLAEIAGETQAVLEETGFKDLEAVRTGIHRLSISGLSELSLSRQKNLLRTWFLSLEREVGIPVPDHYVIEKTFSELIPAARDAMPVVSWHKEDMYQEIRRHGDHLYIVQPVEVDREVMPLHWSIHSPLELQGLGRLELEETDEPGFSLPADGSLEVRFRHEGESCKPAGRKTRSLKKIFQDYGVPPWLRDQIPLICKDGQIVAVADLFVTDQHQVAGRSPGVKKNGRIRWVREDLHCGY